MRDQFRSDLAIGAVHIPVLMIHGEGDEVIPIHSAKRLFKLANAPKVFISAPCCDHEVLDRNDVFLRVCNWNLQFNRGCFFGRLKRFTCSSQKSRELHARRGPSRPGRIPG